jgi:hypothetical protein
VANFTCPDLFSLCSKAPQVDGSHGFSAASEKRLRMTAHGV